MSLLELATSIEALPGGSFYINKEILRALGYTWRGMDYWNGDDKMWRGSVDFTSSIDAAMMLVPEGYASALSEAWGPDRTDWTAVMKRRSIDGSGVWPKATSSKPALALCAAALRARAVALTPPQDQTP
jgi:hypothetical protein